MNKNIVKCPKCQTEISVEDVLASQIEEKVKDSYKQKWEEKEKEIKEQRELLETKDKEIKQKEEKIDSKVEELVCQQKAKFAGELKLKELELEKKKKEMEEEKDEAIKEERKRLQQKIKLELEGEMKTEMDDFRKELEEKNQKISELKQKELNFIKKEKGLKEREQDMDLELERKMANERKKMEDEFEKYHEEKHRMELREKEEKIGGLKKLIEDLKRKSEQGSTQMQGEVQELELEDILRELFPDDEITSVGKGVEGADVMHNVKDRTGKICGTILYESKRTKGFSEKWIEKLKQDQRKLSADLAIIVTQILPKEMNSFGEQKGVWICRFSEVKGIICLLRKQIKSLDEVKNSQQNKGTKMEVLYQYLIGNEFRQQLEAIVEGFIESKDQITRERIAMEKQWKQREKINDKVLINTANMYGAIKGIAGGSIQDIKILELPGETKGRRIIQADNIDEDEGDVILSKRVSDVMNFSTRTINVLGNSNINTIGDIIELTEEDLAGLEGMGMKGVKEVKKCLGGFGLTLKNNNSLKF